MAIMDDFLKKSKYLHNHSQVIKWSEEMERDMDIGELLTEHGRLQKVLVMRTSIPLLHPQPLLLYILDRLLELAHAN